MKKVNWKYAFGEILIVIIGITVAFALNNWSAGIKEKRLKQRYVESLQSDLQLDVDNLQTIVGKLEARFSFIQQQLIPSIYTLKPVTDTTINTFFAMVDPLQFIPRTASFESLKYSGDLKLLEEVALRNMIFEHYDTYQYVEGEYDRHVLFAKDYLARYFMENMDFSKLKTPEGLTFLGDPYFKNLCFSFMGIHQQQLQAHKKALKSAKLLLKELEGS